MTIRSRLLLLLLPTLSTFIILISTFFYYNWSQEILETKKHDDWLISTFSPLLNDDSKALEQLKSDSSITEINTRLNKAWMIILLASCLTLLFIVISVYLIAEKISKPVRQLNQAALQIAAGDYEANIKLEGPKEIVELSQTLNTMSECLVEHINRLRESSLIRERMYGEYECALLLQHQMLQKLIGEFNHPSLRMLLISIPLSTIQKGLLLKINRDSSTDLTLTLVEASEHGFSGLFALNQWIHLPKDELKNKAYVECQFRENFTHLRYSANALFPPLVWSIEKQQFTKVVGQEIPLAHRDMIFLYNSSLIEQFKSAEAIEAWFALVLRHFAEDGLETINTMLTNELTFLAKNHHIKHNFKIISIQLT